MRTAVLLYGHTRTFERCAGSLFKYFIDPLSADVFIHTWDVCESVTPSWHDDHVSKKIPTDQELLHKVYNPTKCIVESQPIYKPDEDLTGPGGISAFGCMRMFESLYKSNQLKSEYEIQNDFIYDVVLKIRPDIMLYSPLYANSNISQLQNGHFLYGSNNTRAVDIINICTSNTMDDVCRLYTSIRRFDEPDVFTKYLKHISVKMINLNFNYKTHWTILRESDND